MFSPIRILSKPGQENAKKQSSEEKDNVEQAGPSLYEELGILRPQDHRKPHVFNLIDDKTWNIIKSEPTEETPFLSEGHAAMSIISVIGPQGVGKSSLMNIIAGNQVFNTHRSKTASSLSSSTRAFSFNNKHITKGVDIYATHQRILLDCQPFLATSVLENFYSGYSLCLADESGRSLDPMISAHMISLQLATFLIATSDYVILMSNWLIDIHLLKLLSTAIMMIGEEHIRAKLVSYCPNDQIPEDRLKTVVDSCLGKNRIEKYFKSPHELIRYTSAYSSEKCNRYMIEPHVFTGKNWLQSCDRLWTTSIMKSSMFSYYAHDMSYMLG